jgi:hypothetical protein
MQGLQNDGLARAGFSGQNGQAAAPPGKIELKRVYQRHILNTKFTQHGSEPLTPLSNALFTCGKIMSLTVLAATGIF